MLSRPSTHAAILPSPISSALTFEDRSLSNASDTVEGVGQGHLRNELRKQVPRIPGAQGGENEQQCLENTWGEMTGVPRVTTYHHGHPGSLCPPQPLVPTHFWYPDFWGGSSGGRK